MKKITKYLIIVGIAVLAAPFVTMAISSSSKPSRQFDVGGLDTFVAEPEETTAQDAPESTEADETVADAVEPEETPQPAQQAPIATYSAPAPAATPAPTPAPEPAPVSGTCYDWFIAAGGAASDWNWASFIFHKESGCRYHAINNESGAFGVCQALPAEKMASAGADWHDNPVTQMKWCISYAHSRYGSWQAAYNFWQAKHWW